METATTIFELWKFKISKGEATRTLRFFWGKTLLYQTKEKEHTFYRQTNMETPPSVYTKRVSKLNQAEKDLLITSN